MCFCFEKSSYFLQNILLACDVLNVFYLTNIFYLTYILSFNMVNIDR